MTKYLITSLLLLTIGCRDRSDHYWINSPDEERLFSIDHDGILFLTESANYQSLQTLQDTIGLKQYLSEDEMKIAFVTTLEFQEYDTLNYYNTEVVPWDTLFVTDNFVAELILIKDNTYGRGYFFQIRTYDKTRKIISMQDFATWADRTKKYCSGDFSISDQTFTVTCNDSKVEYEFDKNGKIISKN